MSTVVRCVGVSAGHGARTVLEGVDLELRRGEVTAVVGPNGAGKTTLLQTIAGLTPPHAGRIERHGRVAAALQAPALARRTALGNVELALAWWGVGGGRKARRARALDALRSLGADAFAGRPARSLSGGEMRRVHLARALAVEPDALLLDEPFAGLDASTRADLLYDAASAVRGPNRATLVVVHDRAEAWALADRVVVLMDGGIRAEGTPEEVFNHPPTEQVAGFVGFAGRVEQPGRILRLRPADVTLDDSGAVAGLVSRTVPLEDGVRLELTVAGGRVVAAVPSPGAPVGARVRVTFTGGMVYPAATPALHDEADASDGAGDGAVDEATAEGERGGGRIGWNRSGQRAANR